MLRLSEGALRAPSDLLSETIREMAVYSWHTAIQIEQLQTLPLVKFTQPDVTYQGHQTIHIGQVYHKQGSSYGCWWHLL